jgi:hypothetical protein
MNKIKTISPIKSQTFKIGFDLRSCHPDMNEHTMRAIMEKCLSIAARNINAACPSIGLDVSLDTMNVNAITFSDDPC